jgi:DNA-directed RNA polymerase subunit D
MLVEVPVMAVEEVSFQKNSSALYDEIISHRLGLVVLKTDLKSYELPESEADIVERKAKCTLLLTLKAKGPKTVYASDLKTADPKVVPVYPKTVLLSLLKDQEIELEAVAVMGQGKSHAKWSPGHIHYTYSPIIKINNKDPKYSTYKNSYPKEAFNKKGELDADLIIKNNLVDACEGVCEDIVKIEYDKDNYIFYVETWGFLTPKEILMKSIDIMDEKLEELEKHIKKI